jgi:hypothetical protein
MRAGEPVRKLKGKKRSFRDNLTPSAVDNVWVIEALVNFGIFLLIYSNVCVCMCVRILESDEGPDSFRDR